MKVKDYRRQVEDELARHSANEGSRMTTFRETSEGDAWRKAIDLLADSSADAKARQSALQHLQAATFLGAQFDAFRPDYIAALRVAAISDDASLRKSALDVLVNFKDDFARQKLEEGLRGTGEPLLPPAAALGLLARDDHGSASRIARDLLGQSTDNPLRAQAVRLLAADPTAKPLLVRILTDKDEFREVRRASAVALQSLDPAAFAQTAGDILSDSGDFRDIKATVEGALSRTAPPLPNQTNLLIEQTLARSGLAQRFVGMLLNLFSGRPGS